MRTTLVFSATVGTISNVVSAFSPDNTIMRIQATNLTAAVAYLQIFNTMAASVTVGTTAPLASIGVATSSTSPMFDFPEDGWFVGSLNGLAVVCTTTRAGLTAASMDCNIWMGQ